MKSIHIRDVPEPILDRLKLRAAAHHRSLQQEIKYLLAAAAHTPLPKPGKLKLHLARSHASTGSWSRDEIYQHDAR